MSGAIFAIFILKFLIIFGHGAPHFHFAQDLVLRRTQNSKVGGVRPPAAKLCLYVFPAPPSFILSTASFPE